MKAVVCSWLPWWLEAEWAGLVTHHCNTTDRRTVSLPTHTHRVSTILSQVYNLPLTTSQQLYKHWRIRAAKTCQHFRPAPCFRTNKQTAVYLYRTLRSVPNQDGLLSHLTVKCFEGCSKLYLNSLAFQWQVMTFTLGWSLGLFSSEGGGGSSKDWAHEICQNCNASIHSLVLEK